MSDITLTNEDGDSITIDALALHTAINTAAAYLPDAARIVAFTAGSLPRFAVYQCTLVVTEGTDGTQSLDWDWTDALLEHNHTEGASAWTWDQAKDIEAVLIANRDTLTPAGRIIDGVFRPTARM